MNSHVAFTGLVVLAFSHLAVAAERPTPREALNRYYEQVLNKPFLVDSNTPAPKELPPPWEAPFKSLASDKTEERRDAIEYLRSLMILSLEDETSGKAPWRNTPYWGDGPQVPSRILRGKIVRELPQIKPVHEMLPLLQWLFDTEQMDFGLQEAIGILGKLEGETADKLRIELASKPHPNAAVVTEALRQITTRKLKLPAATLAALCQNHRSNIREAAYKLNAQQGGPAPEAFDPVKALHREPLAGLLGRATKLMPDLPKADAPLVIVTSRYLDDKKVERRKEEDRGWLLRKEKDAFEIDTLFGRRTTFKSHHQQNVKVRSLEFDDIVMIDAWVEVSVKEIDLAVLVKEVVEIRQKNDPEARFSERGKITRQFERSGPSLFENILAVWLYRAGHDEDAAKLLIPAIESTSRDDGFLQIIQQQIGNVTGQKMLVAFAGDRDYPQTIKLAKQIDELYPETRFYHFAKELSVQLPKRMDDYTKLKLPTATEWANLQKTLTRDQQIEYLCQRMRLLNCFQNGQPGGHDLSAEQYAEPCGLSKDAAWSLTLGKTEVINPFAELTGRPSFYRRDRKLKGMELTLKDVPRLTPFLQDDWYMPIVGLWRNFHPNRNLSRTRPLFASLINSLAHKNICQTKNWTDLTLAEIEKDIERIHEWAAKNAHETPAQLEWEALKEEMAAGKSDWNEIDHRVEKLLEYKDNRAFEIMVRTFKKSDSYSRYRILELYREYDVQRAKDLAIPYLKDEEEKLRTTAALIVFETGDKSLARPILGEELENGERWFEVFEVLLKDNTPESRQYFDRVFSNEYFVTRSSSSRPKMLKQLNIKTASRFYLQMLQNESKTLIVRDKNGKEIASSSSSVPVNVEFAEEITTEFSPDDPEIKDIVKQFPTTKDQIPHLKKWLQARLDKKD